MKSDWVSCVTKYVGDLEDDPEGDPGDGYDVLWKKNSQPLYAFSDLLDSLTQGLRNTSADLRKLPPLEDMVSRDRWMRKAVAELTRTVVDVCYEVGAVSGIRVDVGDVSELHERIKELWEAKENAENAVEQTRAELRSARKEVDAAEARGAEALRAVRQEKRKLEERVADLERTLVIASARLAR